MDYCQSAGYSSVLPEELLRILGSECLKLATKWTLTQTRRRYFLNIVVSRRQPFKSGAKTEGRPYGPEAKAEDGGSGIIPPNTHSKGSGLSEQSDSKAEGHIQPEKTRASSHSDSCNTSTGTRKKRSPSTVKRNRERWDRWQAGAGKWGLSSTKPGNLDLLQTRL